ncbi:MAG: hypothetical protein Q9195_002734 [Heterodermia aff. obscurata]
MLIAHSLAGIPNRPPITLLSGSLSAIHRFRQSGRRIELVNNGISEIRGGFDIEPVYAGSETEPHNSSVVSSGLQILGRADTSRSYNTADELNVAKGISAPEVALPVEKSVAGEKIGENDTTLDASRDAIENEAILSNAKQGKDFLSTTSDDQDFISNLIVSLNPKNMKALSGIAHRLTKESVILLVQNGMGSIENINEKIFPDPQTRPTYIIGVISHGVKRVKAYSIVRAGHGIIALGVLPRVEPRPAHSISTSARYLLQTITRTPVLAAAAFELTDILQYQLERLAVNCVIHPLTAVMDCTNGELLHNPYITRMMRLVLAEISLVVRSLPELQDVPNIQRRFDPGQLEYYVNNVVGKTFQDESSMLHDVRAGRPTELDYLNGWVIRKGEELGIRCVMNYMLVQMVKAKLEIVKHNDSERLPIGSQDSLMLTRR